MNYWEAAIASLESINRESLIFRLDSTSALIFQGLWTSDMYWFSCASRIGSWQGPVHFQVAFCDTSPVALPVAWSRDETSTAELSNIRAVRNLLRLYMQ